MARPLRIEFPRALYHLTARGNARQDIFLADADRELFIDLLSREIGQQRWICHAYCLMPNHYHLLIETPEPNLVRGMTRFNGVYTQAFNRRHGRVGHVFQGRYKGILVDKDSYFLEVARYIVLNPVRAALANRPASWKWSSYRATAGEIAPPKWLTIDAILQQLAASEPAAQRSYREFVARGAGVKLWDQLRGQIWLGNEVFLKRMEKLATGAAKEVPRAQHRPARPTTEAILSAVATAYGVSRGRLLDRSHQHAFRAAVYLLRRATNLKLGDVATLAKISVPRVSQIQSEIERQQADSTLNRLTIDYKVKT